MALTRHSMPYMFLDCGQPNNPEIFVVIFSYLAICHLEQSQDLIISMDSSSRHIIKKL